MLNNLARCECVAIPNFVLTEVDKEEILWCRSRQGLNRKTNRYLQILFERAQNYISCNTGNNIQIRRIMPYSLARVKVGDYAKWKPVFDQLSAYRKDSCGAKGGKSL
jgi:hypothetical protein